jgi:hypothetical protein
VKKILILTAILCMVFVAGSAYALPFASLGWVDPSYDNSWDETTATGTARYSFSFDNPSVEVDGLELLFEGDIFDLSALTASDFNVVAPSGWTTSMFVSQPGLKWSISGGTAITAASSPIILDVDYVLLDANRYKYGNNQAAGDATEWGWLEAQGANSPWSQEYHLTGTYNLAAAQCTIATSGGSTAPAAPEPATMLLFGPALLGLVGFRRKRA